MWGVFLLAACKDHLATLCKARSVACDPDAVYAALEYDDMLAACVAWLLLWTDPKALPPVGEVDAGWALYQRTWRPGKPASPDLAGTVCPGHGRGGGLTMLAFMQRIWGYVVAAVAAIAAVALVYLRGRSVGRADERQEHNEQVNEQAAKACQEVRNVEDEVARLDDDAVSDRLKSDWVRGSGGKGGS